MNFNPSSNEFSQHFLQSNDNDEAYYGIGDSLVITKVDQDQESKEESQKKMIRGSSNSNSNKLTPGSISITSAATPANIPTPGRISRGRNSASSNASGNSDDGNGIIAEESSNKKLFKCNICNYLTAVKARFTKHIKYHSMPLIKCEFCGFKTPYKWNLDRHLRNHGGGGALTCPLCNFTAEIKQSLTVHIQNHHSDVGSEKISELVGSVLKQQGGAFQHGQQLQRETSLFPGQHFLHYEETEEDNNDEIVEKSQQHCQAKPSTSNSNQNLKSSLPTANISKPVSNSIKLLSSNSSTSTQNHKGKNGTDFIHPDDIIEKNGKVYIKKLSCKFCDYRAHFETEMSRHMSKDHGFNVPKRKSSADSSVSISITTSSASSAQSQSKKMPSLIPIQKSPPTSDNDNDYEKEQQNEIKQEKDTTDKKSFLESLCLKPKGIPSSTTMTITPAASSTSVNMKNSNDKDNEMVITPVVPMKVQRKSDDIYKDELDEKMDITPVPSADQQNNFNNISINGSKNKLPRLTRAPSPSNSVKSDDSQPPTTTIVQKYRPPQPPTLKPITGSTSSKLIIDMKKKKIIPSGGQINVNKIQQSQQQQGINNSNQIKLQQQQHQQQQQQQTQQKKVLWKCKKCEFRHSSKELVVHHIREDHKPKKGEQVSILQGNNMTKMGDQEDENENKAFQGETTQYMYNEKTFGCKFCPYKVGSLDEMERHSENHFSKPDCNFSCSYCSYSVSTKTELMDHLQLHGDSPGNEAGGEEESKKRKRVLDPTLTISQEETPPKPRDYGNSPFKKYHCAKCPYETSSKGQFLYHKQFHQPVNAPFKCNECSYNVSHKHLLHQHLRVHGLSTFQMDQEDQDFMNNDNNDNNDESVQPKRLKTQQQYEQYDNHDQMDGSSQEAMPSSHPTKVIWQNGKSYRIFQCRMCPLIFNQVDDLTDHESTSHGITPPGKRMQNQNRQENMNIEQQQHDQIDNKINDDSSPSKRNYLYLCEECPARYPFEKEYQIHKTFHQKTYPYRCNLCTYSARQNNPHLLSHMKVHTDDYQRKTEFLLQTMTVFPNSSIISPLNSQSSTSDKLRNELLKGKSSSNSTVSPQLKKQILTCTQCPASFISSEALKEHHFMVHQPKIFNCTMCDFVCDNETILLIHNQKHDESTSHLSASEIKLPPFDAEREAEAFVGNPEFVYPTLNKNGRVRTKRYKCKKCPSAFEKRDQYYVHIGLHGSNQRYKCSICDYSVTFYANFIQHVKKHATQDNCPRELLAIKPLSKPRKGYSSFDGFTTEEMIKQSATPISPAKEKEIHPVYHKNSIWKCNRCPFKAVDKRSLEQHLNHHKLPIRSAKTLTCNFCDFSINQIQSMKEHMLLHFSSPADNLEPTTDSYMILDDIEIYADVGKNHEKLFIEKENYNFNSQDNKCTADDGEKKDHTTATGTGEDLKITFVDIKTGYPILPLFGENNDPEDN